MLKGLRLDIASTSYRIEKQRNPENWRKTDKLYFLPIFLQLFLFWPIFLLFSVFGEGGFYSVAGQRDGKPRRTKNTTHCEFTMRSEFTIALWFPIAVHFMRAPSSLSFPGIFPSQRRVHGAELVIWGRSKKKLQRSNSLFFYRRSVLVWLGRLTMNVCSVCPLRFVASEEARPDYHAVGNYYLKHSWEYFMRKNMHSIFHDCRLDNPSILAYFCCLLGRTNWERIT